MRLSILIPTYNQDCRQLVYDLIHKCNMPADCEIIVGDDGSNDEETKRGNRKLQSIERVTYWESSDNLGRARIRNRLAQMAKGEYLLFIDSDAVVETEDFIQRFLSCLPTSGVICGGIHHPDNCPSPQVSLRWRYEKACEPLFTAEQRNKNPYQGMRTFNILFNRQVVLQHPFDEDIRQYGYEDTLMGGELKHAGVPVLHIDNPLTNGDIEENDVFLRKTEDSLRTLYEIQDSMSGQSRLIQYINKLQRHRLTSIVLFAYRQTKGAIRHNLLGSTPSVRLFQFYKLGYYLELKY